MSSPIHTTAAAVVRWLRRYAPAALVLVALFELVAGFVHARRAPRFDEYATLREPVDRFLRPGEPLLMAPRWAEPMLRASLGDERMPLAEVARPDLESYPSVIEISALGERAPELAGWIERERTEHGEFVLRRLENPDAHPPRFDFVDGLGPDRVEVGMPSGPCRWTDQAVVQSGGLGGHPTFAAQRFQCRGSPFFHVGITVIADQDFRPRRCIWAHPPARGDLSIRYRDVPLGQLLIGHTGMYWITERERRGAPVELEVLVEGDRIGSVLHADGDGWSRFELPLGRHAGREGTVELRVRSPDHRDRHFCFEARTR